MAKNLDPVQTFLLQPIEQEIPYLFVHTSYYKARDGACSITNAVSVVGQGMGRRLPEGSGSESHRPEK
jgi:hypothetical protein